MTIENRIAELEIKFAHQDNTISELNDVIISHQKTIDDPESRLLIMESIVRRFLPPEIKDLSEESPPPHY